jgi:hypothetical protein
MGANIEKVSGIGVSFSRARAFQNLLAATHAATDLCRYRNLAAERHGPSS